MGTLKVKWVFLNPRVLEGTQRLNPRVPLPPSPGPAAIIRGERPGPGKAGPATALLQVRPDYTWAVSKNCVIGPTAATSRLHDNHHNSDAWPGV